MVENYDLDDMPIQPTRIATAYPDQYSFKSLSRSFRNLEIMQPINYQPRYQAGDESMYIFMGFTYRLEMMLGL